jgi:hypothetical protein
MRKLFTLFLGILLVNVVFAQRPEGVIVKATESPAIDGVVDEIWATANIYNIERNFRTELPSVGDPGQTTWKALWDDDGIYLILQVTDDAFYPNYMVTPAGNDWEYDKPEIYFDCNFILEDGLGGGQDGQGHYQWAPPFKADILEGALQTDANTGIKHAFKVEDPNYVAEYFFPWDYLKDKDGVGFDKTGVMGFDVTIIDRDPGDAARKRAVWANMGALDESWANMDDAGWITFEGAESNTLIESITLTGGAVTEDNGTFQVVATILPADATVKTLKWTVATKEGSTGRASVSNTGVVTGIMDGVVVVTAAAQDGSYVDATCEVTISGQKVTVDEINIIKNGNFDLFDEVTLAPTSWGNWVDGATYGTVPVVTEGVAVLNSTGSHASENWHYQFNQSNLAGIPDIPYIIKFVAWADNDRNICFDFEDTSGNNYNRYGVSSDPESNGRSEWTFPITTEPTWYTFHVTFDQIKSNTVQKIQYMISQATGTVYLDSVSVVSEADMGLVPVLQNKAQTFNIYPNPVDTKLHVTLSSAGEKVAIFNSLGVKLEEVVVPGTHHVFDVSRYSRGLYFVKSRDTVVKFVK